MTTKHKDGFEIRILQLPSTEKIQEFRQHLSELIIGVFNLNEDKKQGLDAFLENTDHGLEHAFNVYKKAMQISDELEQQGEKIDRKKIYVMAIAHDSGRFHISSNLNKQKKCERNHNKCGLAQLRLVKRKLSEQGEGIEEQTYQDIIDYIFNHDFMNTRLDGNRHAEPQSLEGQIVRLADRISTDLAQEARRYWETGKRIGTTYFDSKITFEDRVNFSFEQIKKYIQKNNFDEITFFLALLSIRKEDFKHPILQEIYQRDADKKLAVQTILELAEQEGYTPQQVKTIDELIKSYTKHFGIKI